MFGFDDIREIFKKEVETDKQAVKLWKAVVDGGGYSASTRYARRIGEILAKVLLTYAPEAIGEWDLNDLIPRSLGLDMNYVVRACAETQAIQNKQLEVGIKFQEVDFNADRAYGIVTELENSENFSEVYEKIKNQFTNFSESIVDDEIRANASQLWKSGIKTQVIRRAEATACAWCNSVSGAYDYSEVSDTGNDVWRRHIGCHCTIDFISQKPAGLYTSRINNQKR